MVDGLHLSEQLSGSNGDGLHLSELLGGSNGDGLHLTVRTPSEQRWVWVNS